MGEQAENVRVEDDRLFEFIFGSDRPSVCGLPNLVLKNGSPSLPLVLDIVGRRGGAWGVLPPFARDGSPYLGSEGESDAYFRTWSIEANQRWLRDRGGITCLGSFTMVIDAEISSEFLDYIYRRSKKDYVPLLDDMLPLLVERIENIRWAYFPLTDEYPLAMFLSRPADSHWVDELEEAVGRNGGSCCRTFIKGRRCAWRLPDALKNLCKR